MIIRFVGYARRVATIFFTRWPYGRKFYLRRVLAKNRHCPHPFDLKYGVQTSGFVPNFLGDPGADVIKLITYENNHYAGCQPNCVRQAIRSIDSTTGFIFYDLGCGMGRALLVASEFSFTGILGIELSGELCAIARKNAQHISETMPERTSISIQHADAGQIEFQHDKIIVFLYHSFGRATIKPILRKLEVLARNGGDVFIIFENPVNADLVDQSDQFYRWYAEQVDCENEELDHHSDPNDGVVVWRSNNGPSRTSLDHNDFEIVITKPSWRAEVVMI